MIPLEFQYLRYAQSLGILSTINKNLIRVKKKYHKEMVMKRWNGWGETHIEIKLPAGAQNFLAELVGRPSPQKNAAREKMLTTVPPSRIDTEKTPDFIYTDQACRLDHAHGQSLPDWTALRFGTLNRFADAVAKPETESQVEDALGFADKHEMTVIPYGGGTSVVGHLEVPDTGRPAMCIDLQRCSRLHHLDTENHLAEFDPGVNGPGLEAALKAHGYTLGHYPQSFDYSTLGGWVVTRSSGQQSLYYGRIEDLFAGGRMIAPAGRLNLPPFPASAAGPDLRHAVLGSEGRMGILTRALVRVRRLPETDDVYGIFLPTWKAARDAVQQLVRADLPLSMLRLSSPVETMTNLVMAGHEKQIGMLKKYLRIRGLHDSTWCMLLLGVIGDRRAALAGKKRAMKIIRKHGGVSAGTPMGKAWKKNRFLAPYLRNTLWDRGYAVDTLETAVTWDRVDTTMKNIEASLKGALEDENEKIHVFSHLSHVYPTGSSIYTTYVFRIANSARKTLARWHSLKKAASQAIVDAGGTISHQHGVGVDHKAYLQAEKGELGVDLIRTLSARMDPFQRFNTGKLFDTELTEIGP